MPKDGKLKIFISAHKPTEYVQNNIFTLVQVGASLPGRDRLPGAQQDNTGKNISDKNQRFCELTAHYWAWKNQKADYYGFFHYRRYLSFNEDIKSKPDIWGNIIENNIDEDFTERHHLTSDSIEKLVEKYDIILPSKKDITLMPNMGKNMKDQYIGSGFLHENDLETMMEVLEEKYPDYLPYAKKYLNGHKTYLNNMFIMKKDIFFDYSEWLFDILFECDKRIDFSNYSTEAIRTPGHLAERLLNIYISYQLDKNHYKIKELPTVAILNTDPIQDYAPAFEKNNIAITLSADDYYVPYVGAVITSILDNSSKNNNYDVFIMNKDIRAINKQRLMNIFAGEKNFSLRFIDISRFENRFQKLFT